MACQKWFAKPHYTGPPSRDTADKFVSVGRGGITGFAPDLPLKNELAHSETNLARLRWLARRDGQQSVPRPVSEFLSFAFGLRIQQSHFGNSQCYLQSRGATISGLESWPPDALSFAAQNCLLTHRK